MPKLRADLLRNLSPDDQTLMKTFRKTPLKAYSLEELLPAEASFEEKLKLIKRLNSLINLNPPLLMKIKDGDKTLYTKAKRVVSSQNKRRSS